MKTDAESSLHIPNSYTSEAKIDKGGFLSRDCMVDDEHHHNALISDLWRPES